MSTVLLDLDDTLVDQVRAADAAVVAWAPTLGVTGEPAELARRWAELSEPHYRRYQAREISFAEQRRARVRELAPHLDLSDDAEADRRFAGYLEHYRAGWCCFDDAVPTLRRLRRQGLRVGVLTNGDEAQQRDKLDVVGLTAEIDVLIASSTLPFGKPHPLAFAAAVERLGVRAEEVLMVGDSLENDVRGALAAGMSAVLLDRTDAHAGVDVPRIRGLDELELPEQGPARR
ncbi:HAD-IA family hydrolase [Auraticoccus sp. F435]|uniref:HAD-IA family hydrolase n=1 Tax=Auraticoccus cholistanensis TaxID=2656650 RepID=A0A6A9UVB3_9ACTN|nr:HAD-IA family hydrolase [Auraticoccus cholistanensis]